MAAYFSCFIAVEAGAVCRLFGGEQYHSKQAIAAMSIMAIYPLHQTYGQLSGSLFYATDRTRLLRNIQVTLYLIGVPMTFLAVGPEELFGWNGGAQGLALKMVALQFIGVNIQLFYNARMLSLSMGYYLLHQILSAAVFFCLARSAHIFVSLFCSEESITLHFLLSGFTYSIGMLILLMAFPVVCGVSREDIANVKKRVLSRMWFN